MCGFVGMVAGKEVAHEIHVALQAIQHRGQDSAGIATMSEDGDRFCVRRGLGTADKALGREDLAALRGPIGIGHVRYPTIGRGVLEDAQPFFYRQPGILMAHNGNLTNYEELRRSLRDRSIHLLSHCDVEPALCELADALMSLRRAHHRLDDVVRATSAMVERVRGSYSIVAALAVDEQPTLLVVRDPHGIRPVVTGRRADGSYLVASESVALDALGFEPMDEPEPGEVVVLRSGEPPRKRALVHGADRGDSDATDGARPTMPEPSLARDRTPCVFEYIYFARPDSVMGGRSVYEVRLALGRELGSRIREKGIDADVVIPVPDTARPAATTLAEELGLPIREGLIKNRYSGRTFIMPDQLTRNAALRLKLNPLPSEMAGRRVLLVDDSIVRGTTLGRVIALVRSAGAAEVHLAIHSPPVLNPCFYGIDMSTDEELFARRFEAELDAIEQGAASALGADSLTYVTVEGMDRAFEGPRCAACFDGHYPEAIPEAHRAAIAGDRRGGAVG